MSVADELGKLAALKERGLLTEEEFLQQKDRLLSGSEPESPTAAPTNEEAAEPEKKGGGAFFKVAMWLIGGVVAFFVFGATVGNTPEAKARIAAQDAIAICWKGYERKSLSPNEQRLIAGACEKMEADYRLKFGRNP